MRSKARTNEKASPMVVTFVEGQEVLPSSDDL